MTSKRLWIDKRVVVTGTKSHIKLDNPVAIHSFIINLLKDLPKYADNAAAVTGGEAVGDLYNNTTTNAITYVV